MALYTCLIGFDFDDHSEGQRNPNFKKIAKRIQENIFKILRKRTIHGKNQRNAKMPWNGACDGSINRKDSIVSNSLCLFSMNMPGRPRMTKPEL